MCRAGRLRRSVTFWRLPRLISGCCSTGRAAVFAPRWSGISIVGKHMRDPSDREMTCRELVELVTDYLEGALPADVRRRFDEHFASCPFCRIYLDQIRETIRAAGRLPDESISSEAFDALLAHFRRWR